MNYFLILKVIPETKFDIYVFIQTTYELSFEAYFA